MCRLKRNSAQGADSRARELLTAILMFLHERAHLPRCARTLPSAHFGTGFIVVMGIAALLL